MLVKFEKYLSFLSSYDGVAFGKVTEHIGDGSKVLIWIIVGFIVLLLFKNSTQRLESFKLNYKTSFFAGALFLGGVLSLNKVSEFLYFNF